MSYTDDFFNALEKEEKKKKKKKNGSVATAQPTTSPSGNDETDDSFTDQFHSELQRLTGNDYESFLHETEEEVDYKKQADIAIRNALDETWAMFDDGEDGGLHFFKTPKAFEDGWQFGDLATTILSSGFDGLFNGVKGFLNVGEGLMDAAGSLDYFVSGLLGQSDEVREIKKQAIEKEWVSDAMAPIISFYDENSVFDTTSDSVFEGIGQLGAMYATGGLGGAAGLGTTGTSVLTTSLVGTNAFGSGVGEAFSEGATDGEAFAYGLSSATTEVVAESLFGGLGKGINAVGFNKGALPLDDMASKAVSKFFKSQTGKNVSEYLVKSGFEGFEEVIAGYLQAHAKKGTFKSEEDFAKILEDENLFEQFVVGGLVSGGAQIGDLSTSISEKSDFVTGFTQNEQAVLDKEFENRIAESEKDGNKLSRKDKNNLWDQVIRDMDRGYISTDTIEEVLGGDSYKSYKDIVDSEDALVEQEKTLSDEYNQLNKKPWRDMTGEEMDRREELKSTLSDLRAKIADNKKTSKRDQLKSNLGKDVFNKVKNDRLVESYLDKARAGEDFQADFGKYKGTKHEDAAKKTLENAVKAGANNTNRVHDFIDPLVQISADTGLAFDFQTDEQIKDAFIARHTKKIAELEGIENRTAEQNELLANMKDQLAKVQSGELIVNGNNTAGHVVLNLDSKNPLNVVVGHEVTHSVEKAKSYGKLEGIVLSHAKTKGIDIDSRLKAIEAKYAGEEGANPRAELVADLVGEFLFTDGDFVRNLSTQDRNIFQKIYDEIKYLCKIVTAGSKEARELEKVKKAFEDAYREAEQSSEANEVGDTETKYSLREAEPPQETGVAYKVFFVKDGKLYPPMVANPDGADTPMGVWLDADVGTSAPPSKTGRAQVKAGGKGTQGGSGSLAFRPGWHLGDLPRASQFDRVNPETGKKELFPENFVWAEVEYAKDVDYQEEAMSYGYTENGKFRHAYAGLPRLPENGYYRYRTNPKPDTVPWIITGAMKVNRLLSDAEVNQILEENGVAPVHRQGGDVGLDKFGFDESGGVKYSLSANAKSDVHSALVDKNYAGEVKLTDTSPSILLSQKGVRNLPMVMNASHIRENIFTEAEAKSNGLRVSPNINYHGLGEELFLKVIDDLDNVREAYRGTKNADDPGRRENYFLLISQQTDKAGNIINVPVYINEKGVYNRVFIDTNKIATVFGRSELREYIKRQINQGNLVRIKNRSTQASESTSPIKADYGMDTSTTENVAQVPENVKTQFSVSAADSDGNQLSKEQQEFFKDSKVRDENGNLKVMYHGTPNGNFTVFKAGTYFTDNKEYADRYQNPGASSISTGKSASAPKTYEVYLDIKKPFDLNDAEARRIYIEDYIKGGNAIGINPYLSDAEYGNIKTIDWTEGEDLRDFLVENEYDYDGLVLDEGADGGYGADVKSRGTSYVVFNPKQVKSVANKAPTSDPDIRYSLSDSDGKKLTTEQQGFFKNSKVRDMNGNLLRVYHGSKNSGFNVFQYSKDVQTGTDYGEAYYFTSDRQKATGYSYDVTKDERVARYQKDREALKNRFLETHSEEDKNAFLNYTLEGKKLHELIDDESYITDGGEVKEVYLNLVNPLVVDAGGRYYYEVYPDYFASARKNGNDGIIIRNVIDNPRGEARPIDTYIAFSPNQIKSVTNENPTDNPDIHLSMSNRGEEFAPIGKNDFFGKDFRKKSADDIAPVAKNATTAPAAEDIAPVAEVTDAKPLAGDRDSFVSQKAMELYKEITSLKKGVRASKSLGYLLDHGHDWRSIKTALLNIRDNPNQVVNPNSAAESVAREMLGREYDAMASELAEPSNVAESIRSKMQHIQTEIANNERLREQSALDYDSEIADVQAEYDAKKNKNTIVANDLLRRIERLNRMKNTNDDRFAKRIGDLEARLEKMRQPTYKRAVQRKAKQDEYTNLMKSLVGDTSTWVDKKLGISYKVNTLRRNLRDVVRDANGKRDIPKADAIYDELQGKYNHTEAELKRESRRLKSPFAELNPTHAEETYAHMLGEFRHNPDSKLTEEAVKEYYEKHKNKIDTQKVDKYIEGAIKTFDELFVRLNERLREQGMKEIPYRKGYFPHFTNPKQGWLAKLFNWKTVDTEIPTSIAGLTETFNPERSWQGFSKQRKGDTTDYNLAQALDTYIHGALDWIYHIEDIQKRRALENYIRYIHSEEGVKAEIDKIHNDEELDADEAQKRIDAVYAEAKNPLNNFVTNLRAGTNTLANKKSENDRQMESDTNRKIYSVMTNLNNRISANMVVGSFSSALTNFIPITQSWMEVSPVYSLRGMKDTIKSTIRDDGIVHKSDFLTNRLRNEENLYQTKWDKISDKVAIMMEAIDNFTSQTVWRSKYLQNISEGMSETEAIKNADQFAENVIAGRSRGNMPTIFDAKNPITKIFTAFQLEVNNQYGYMFKDAPQDSKNKAKLIKGYATAFLGAYAYNALYSSLVGRDAAFDPISILEDLFRDMGLLGDDEEEEPDEILNNFAENIIQEVPFVGGLMGGGRIPISSAIPYGGDYKTFISDVTNGEVSTKEWLKPVYYLALPFGGGQIKKINEGLGMFSDDHPIAGSYTDSGNLRFPVEDNLWNRAQAVLFGQYANENARDYFDNERSPLKEEQIQEFIDLDIPIRDYWEYREGLSGLDSTEEKLGYISTLDLPYSKKNILANNIVDRKEPVDMFEYGNMSHLEEFNYSQTNKNLHDILQNEGISSDEYESFDDDTKDAYKWAAKNPEKYTVSKAISGDFMTYYQYKSELGEIEADKDEDGKSISGSRKEKVVEYINNLDLDYGQKIILFKSMYDSKEDRNTYNAEIVEYLDSRDDISYEEMVTILTELGMRVEGNNVYWD